MNGPLFLEGFTVQSTDDEYDLAAEPSGPAGVCTLPIGGITLRFDTAEPERLCGIEVQAGTNAEDLAVFIGAERADAVLSRAPSSLARAQQVPRLDDIYPSLRRGPRGATAWSEAASLWTMAHDVSMPDLARAAAALDLTLRCPPLEEFGVPGVDALRTEHVALAASLLRTSEKEVISLAEDEPSTAAQLAALCRRVGVSDRIFSATARRIDRLTAPPSEPKWRKFGMRSATMSSSIPMDAAGDDLMFSASVAHRMTVPVELHTVQSPVDLRAGGRLVLHPPADQITGPDCWVRVIRAGSLTLLALVPLRREGRNWRAEALIPPGLTVDDIELDVVAPTALFRPSRLEQARDAFALGREAVGVGNAGHDSSARRMWSECAQAWEALGDAFRAGRARAYAQQRPRWRPAMVAEDIAFADDIRRTPDPLI